MNSKNNQNDQPNSKKYLDLFLNEGQLHESALENDTDFQELIQLEESIVNTIQLENEKHLDHILEKDSSFYEDLDIAKANLNITPDRNRPLPLYLKNYMEADFAAQKKEEDRLVIRFGKAGVKLLGSFFGQTEISPLELSIPSVRNSINTTPQSISMLEKTDQGNLVYQVIQENENEAYLSVKFDPSFVAIYNQVNLRKDNRFIYSSNINSEGIVSFSGLKEG
ncbi:MAG TPA: hypothetical protein PLS71_25385, partial [Leptospiraceae bacterium]|nr:hypothetical protein [Leptospiraceae bacterium]